MVPDLRSSTVFDKILNFVIITNILHALINYQLSTNTITAITSAYAQHWPMKMATCEGCSYGRFG